MCFHGEARIWTLISWIVIWYSIYCTTEALPDLGPGSPKPINIWRPSALAGFNSVRRGEATLLVPPCPLSQAHQMRGSLEWLLQSYEASFQTGLLLTGFLWQVKTFPLRQTVGNLNDCKKVSFWQGRMLLFFFFMFAYIYVCTCVCLYFSVVLG